MMKTSRAPGGETLYSTVLVAFDPVGGRIYGTFVHTSSQRNDHVGVQRARKRFLADLSPHCGGDNSRIETVELRLDEFPTGSLQRVDPKTHKLITSPNMHLSGIARTQTE
jgi:hypothetical protein